MNIALLLCSATAMAAAILTVLFWYPGTIPVALSAIVGIGMIGYWWRPEARPVTAVYVLSKAGGWCRTAAGRHLSWVTGVGAFSVWHSIFQPWTDWPRDILNSAVLALLIADGMAAVLNNIGTRLAPRFHDRQLPKRWVRAGYRLPPVPVDDDGPVVVLGEVHPSREYHGEGSWCTIPSRAASYSPVPEYLVLNQPALETGLLIYGATGTGKTSFLLRSGVFPIFAHPSRPGGLVMDSKASLVPDIRRVMAEAGRSEDFFTVGLTGCKWNPIHIPEASAARIADMLMSAKENVNGARFSAETRWIRDGAGSICEASVGILRMCLPDGYVTPIHFRWLLTKLSVACQGEDKPGEMVSDQILSLFGGSEPTDPDEHARYTHYRDLMVSRFSEDEKFRSIYVNELTGLLVRLTDPDCADRFNSPLTELDMPSWVDAVNRGLVCALDCNSKDQPGLSTILGVLLKLGYMDTLTARPALATRGLITSDRCMLLAIDEYQNMASFEDSIFVATSRESKSLNVFATQGPASIEERLGKDQARVLVQSLRNKVIFNIEETQQVAELIGQIDVTEVNRTVNEQQQDAALTLAGKFAGRSSVSESLSESHKREFIVKPEELAKLPTGQFIFVGHDGTRIIPPQRCYGRLYSLPPGTRHADTKQALTVQGDTYV